MTRRQGDAKARPAFKVAESATWATLSADEQRLVKAFRALPAGEPQHFVLRHTEAWSAKCALPPQRPRLALVEKRNTA